MNTSKPSIDRTLHPIPPAVSPFALLLRSQAAAGRKALRAPAQSQMAPLSKPEVRAISAGRRSVTPTDAQSRARQIPNGGRLDLARSGRRHLGTSARHQSHKAPTKDVPK